MIVCERNCAEVYSEAFSGKERVPHAFIVDVDGACQQHQVSPHAPGPVGDQELLARSIDFPLRLDPVEGINDSLFADALTLGASSQRIMTDWDKVEASIHDRYEARAARRRTGEDGRQANEAWRYIGVVHISVKELRDLKLEDAPLAARVRVYDAAHDPDDALHSDIMATNIDLVGPLKEKKKLLRVMLMNIATHRGIFLSPYVQLNDSSLANLQIPLHIGKVVGMQNSAINSSLPKNS